MGRPVASDIPNDPLVAYTKSPPRGRAYELKEKEKNQKKNKKASKHASKHYGKF